jgi:RNA polymerase sigma-70 factor (ECF subfamily)
MMTQEVWTQFSGRLRGFIARRVAGEADVEDVLQEVFARIHSGLGGLKESEKLEAWLFQVARRAILDHYRSRTGKRRAAELPEDVAEENTGETITKEVASWLEPMMALIPDGDREVLRLTDLEGLSQKDLAARLGLSVTGAKSRVQRARKRLKDAVLGCCHVEMDRRGNAIDYTRKRSDCGPCSCE